MPTCNQLDLETLGSRLIVSKNLPGYFFILELRCKSCRRSIFVKLWNGEGLARAGCMGICNWHNHCFKVPYPSTINRGILSRPYKDGLRHYFHMRKCNGASGHGSKVSILNWILETTRMHGCGHICHFVVSKWAAVHNGKIEWMLQRWPKALYMGQNNTCPN